MKKEEYLELNKNAWNDKTTIHVDSDFYDVEGFLKGNTSLNSIELELLGDVSGKKILHLQCHFGLDTLSLTRMGADVTGVDLSNISIDNARELADRAGLKARFINCDVYGLKEVHDEKYDMVYTSYGVIGWLPDIDRWAEVISHFLKADGRLVFIEFHPVVWMFDEDFKAIQYPYNKDKAIIERIEGTYTNKNAPLSSQMVSWNHGMAEIIQALLDNGIGVTNIKEYDYAPYNCFEHTEEFEPGKFRIRHLENKIPMVYSIVAQKQVNG